MSSAKVVLVLAVALTVLATATAAPAEPRWDEFKKMFKRVFNSTDEENQHRSIFERLVDRIERWNEESAEKAGFTLGLNDFSDWSEAEMAGMHNLRVPQDAQPSNDTDMPMLGSQSGNPTVKSLPDSFDWRNVNNVVGPVKNQGQCGSCWAYGVTGTMEAFQQGLGVSSSLAPLSEQNLVDCSRNNGGCQGGWPARAFQDVRSMGGLMTERDYPYEARNGQCRFQRNRALMTVTGSHTLRQGDEELLKRTIVEYGPVSVAIHSNIPNYNSYRSGVFSDSSCKSGFRDADHVMLAVGYGRDQQRGDFWILKNSWGTSWGERGYMRMARGRNMCGVANSGTVPTFN